MEDYIDKITQTRYNEGSDFANKEEPMLGVDLGKPMCCKYASFRFFEEKEHHITRFCTDNVLLLVFAGVLRFSEDGEEIAEIIQESFRLFLQKELLALAIEPRV